jgi:hypothetical protein
MILQEMWQRDWTRRLLQLLWLDLCLGAVGHDGEDILVCGELFLLPSLTMFPLSPLLVLLVVTPPPPPAAVLLADMIPTLSLLA